ncbi:putative metal-binding protein [Geodermatophilus sp. DSM 44513]|uniref:putative metal-binding protein n=1 Tax=Geodermatophilus sp. DSM 44513 TaxID=1528104 RepID=UPI0012833F3E|nr:putative metal-binding protein [Geodermatophilus sp. DSM 44513]WNV75159.1 putative metal-binding protein [Geodermatophilus sp. DSM 44513]
MGAVHPQVTRVKYDREVANLSRDAARHRSLGIFLLAAEYPTVLVGFASPKLKPAAFIFAMHVDYTDYDLQAPSIRFVDPFTSAPYKASEVPTQMMRTVGPPRPAAVPFPPELAGQAPLPGNPGQPPGFPPPGTPQAPPMGGLMIVEQQPLLQAYGPDDIPFLCLPGVREYHDHPGHSGDHWELHRTIGAGSLARLVQVVHTYAVQPVQGWNVHLNPQFTLAYGEPPL